MIKKVCDYCRKQAWHNKRKAENDFRCTLCGKPAVSKRDLLFQNCWLR